jgi:hypothetical protein
MRAAEFLNESFDSNVPITVMIQNRIEYQTSTIISDRKLIFNAAWHGKHSTWQIAFAEVVDKKYGPIERIGAAMSGDKSKTYKDISFDITGSGGQMAVFSFVISSIKQFVNLYHPRVFFFEAKKQGARADLYSRMVSRIKIPGYELTDIGKEDTNTKYFVIKQTDVNDPRQEQIEYT